MAIHWELTKWVPFAAAPLPPKLCTKSNVVAPAGAAATRQNANATRARVMKRLRAMSGPPWIELSGRPSLLVARKSSWSYHELLPCQLAPRAHAELAVGGRQMRLDRAESHA